MDDLQTLWQQQLDAELAFAARKAKPKRRAVVSFGRFNPPTTGHERLFGFQFAEAARLGAVPLVFPSQRQDADNPLPFAEKVQWLTRLFPGLPVNQDQRVRTPMDVLAVLQAAGFDAVWFVVGNDQTQSFERLGRYVKPTGTRDGRFVILKDFGILTVPVPRNPRGNDVSGMSATKLRDAVRHGNYRQFRQGVPTTNERVAKQLYERLLTLRHDPQQRSGVARSL
jgi:hypothetical protein